MKKLLLFFAAMLVAGSMWGTDIASGTFNGKNATYTTGWTTTGTGVGRTDCVIIGKDENITSPSINFAQYSSITITFTGRRYGTLSDSKATIQATVNGTSIGTIDITNGSVGTVSGNISYSTNVSDLGNNPIVFTCTNATSAGSTHGAGIGSITITGELNASTAYTVTFDAGANGSCATASLTEASANAGIILPSCAANTGYVFMGWSTTNGGTTANAGEAGGTYHPAESCTLYAVYESSITSVFRLVFKEATSTDNDSSTKYATSGDGWLTAMFSEGSDYVSSVSDLSNVYPARTGRGAKFGTSKATGKLTINLKKAVNLGKIEVVCAGYASDEKNGFTINGKNFSSTTYASSGFETLTYNTAGSVTAITIETQSKRGYIKSITVYPAGVYAETTISAAAYSTYYNSEFAYTMPDDCEGYVFTAANGLEPIYEGGDVVPAGEPLVIYTIEPGTKTLVFTTSTEATYKSGDMNDLEGTDAETAITNDDNYYYYGLSLNAAGETNSVGFYWMNSTGAAFTNGAHKAYLKLAKNTTSNAPRRFLFETTDTATAVEDVEAAEEVVKFIENGQILIKKNGVVYNAMGQVVR